MQQVTLKPVRDAIRSLFGTHGVPERLTAIEQQLNISSAPGEPVSSEDCTVVPLTKMETVAEAAARYLTYSDVTGDPLPPIVPSTAGAGSRLCRQADLSTDGFRYWVHRMKLQPAMHRKLWEWYFIADALWRLDMLRQGRRGLGFGIGQEPLTPLFAVEGCDLVATDMDAEGANAAGWTKSREHASTLGGLDRNGIALPEVLEERITLRTVDMNEIPPDLLGFDFCWSSCSFEHLGSLRHGIDFVARAMLCLRPGGVAVHTTEFNTSSNDVTFESPGLSLYRRRDIETLVKRLEGDGHRVEPIDWSLGKGFADNFVDLPPYSSPNHLRLRVADHDCTSIGIIIHARA